MPRTPLLLVLCLAALLVGCGGSGGAGSSDPVEVVPSGALFYGEVTVRPEGDVKEDALAAVGKVLDASDPGAELRRLVDELIAESDERGAKVSYTKDIEPWLGDRIGLWLAPEITRDDDAVGLAVALSDPEKARAFLQREKEASDKPGSYRDADYLLDDDNTAFGVVGDRLLIGNLPQFKRMVDTAEGEGETLAESEGFEQAMDPLSDDRLGHVYLDLRGIFDAAGEAASEQDRAILGQFLPKGEVPPVGVGLLADGDRIALETAVSGGEGSASPFGIGGLIQDTASPLLAELPGDAWAAVALPDFGNTARETFTALAGALGAAAVAGQVREQTGLDLEQDVFSWMGDVALYVRGQSLQDLSGAVVIESTDDQKAQKAFAAVAALLARPGAPEPAAVPGAESAFVFADVGLPAPLVLARKAGRVVFAVGEQAASDALAPAAKLGDSELYEAAERALGDDLEPTFLVSVPAVLSLAEGMGAASDPSYAQVKQYIDAFSVLAGGSEKDGDELRSRFSFGLK